MFYHGRGRRLRHYQNLRDCVPCAATDLRDQKYKLESLCVLLRWCPEKPTI